MIDYTSFVIRLWREHAASEAAVGWHSELEHVQSGEHWRFESLDELLRFLPGQAEAAVIQAEKAAPLARVGDSRRLSEMDPVKPGDCIHLSGGKI